MGGASPVAFYGTAWRVLRKTVKSTFSAISNAEDEWKKIADEQQHFNIRQDHNERAK